MRFDKGRVLLKDKLTDVKVGWLLVGWECVVHRNTFKNSRIAQNNYYKGVC